MTDAALPAPPSTSKSHPFWRWFWLSFLVLSLVYAWYSFYVPSNEVDWAENYAAAQARAADTGKPMILFFTGAWCVPCRIMKREVWADEQVTAAVNAAFVPVTIDVDDPAEAAVLSRFGDRITPNTILTDSQGNVLQQRPGKLSKAEFLALLGAASETIAEES